MVVGISTTIVLAGGGVTGISTTIVLDGGGVAGPGSTAVGGLVTVTGAGERAARLVAGAPLSAGGLPLGRKLKLQAIRTATLAVIKNSKVSLRLFMVADAWIFQAGEIMGKIDLKLKPNP